MSLVYAIVMLLKVVTCHLHVFSCSIDFLKKFQKFQLLCLQEAKSETNAMVFQRVAVLFENGRLQKSGLIIGNRWALFYYMEYLINCWSWPLDRAQLGQIFNDQIFLPEMAVRGRCQWEAQAAQVQENGKLGSCRQQKRHLQYFAQVLQQE